MATREAESSKVYYTRNQILLFCGKSNRLQHCIFSLYFFRDCLKKNSLSSPIFSQKSKFHQKSPSNQGFSNAFFWPKPNMRNRSYRKLLNLGLLMELTCWICVKNLGKIWSYKREFKYWISKTTGMFNKETIVYTDSPGKN